MRRSQARSGTGRRAASLLVIGLAALFALVPIPSAIVERLYVRGFYGVLQPLLTFASNAVAFAWLDAFLVAVAVLFLLLAGVDVARRGWIRAIAAVAARTVVWAAALYLVFLATWGFNYRRVRLPDRLPYDAHAVTPEAAGRLALLAVDRANALHGSAHAQGWVGGGAIDPSLAGAFDQVVRDLGAAPRGIVVGRPKHTALDWYFQRAGVAGMTDPLFLETLVAGDVLPFERPFVVAHEWSHLAGITDEGEANLAGWMACTRGSAADQYSGWLFMFGEALRAAPARERAAIAARLAAGPRGDLAAMRERTRQHVSARVSAAGWRVYDSYLKANRVDAGAESYADVVRLALGLTAARPFP
jgi:hypothetical protein